MDSKKPRAGFEVQSKGAAKGRMGSDAENPEILAVGAEHLTRQ